MFVPFLDLKAQYASIKTDVDAAMQTVINNTAFALGPAVQEFEKDFAAFCGAKHCVGVNSGTSALTLLLRAHGIGPDDEVITVANTFFATAEAISLVGATPVLVDCNENDALIDASQIEAAITEKTKAIMPVHLYGQPVDIDAINEIAKRHNLIVIEDAAQAHGAMYKDAPIGSHGNSCAFSFYPGKNLGAYGEAGGIVTNDDAIAETCRKLRDHGMAQKYHHDLVGYNERMDGIQGAVLGVKLKQLAKWNAVRQQYAAQYRNALSTIDAVTLFTAHEDRKSVYHLFVIRVQDRDALQQHLQEKEIQSGLHYPIPVHMQKAYADKQWSKGDFPIAETLSNEILSLPISAEISEEQVAYVCDTISAYYA